jgi:transcriptional regulator with XRE-family HTH domain
MEKDKLFFLMPPKPNCLKDIRKARGLSRRELSEISGTDPLTIQKIENNVPSQKNSYTIKNSTAEKIASALQEPPEAIFEKYEEYRKNAVKLVNPFSDEEAQEEIIQQLLPEIQTFIDHSNKRSETRCTYFGVLTPEDKEELAYQTLSELVADIKADGIPETQDLKKTLLMRIAWNWRAAAKKIYNALDRGEYLEIPLKFFCSRKEYQELQEEITKIKKLVKVFGVQVP